MHKITVILPTYNGATRGNGKYLREAIESVLGQTYKNFELIIINDCSTDNTEDIIKEYNDERIIYLKHNENKGPSAARNTGLMKAVGEYIAFLDDDDFYYENKLEEQLNFMLINSVYISASNGNIIDENNKEIGETKNNSIKRITVNDIYLNNATIFPTAVMIKRSLINNIYFKEYLKGPEDWDFMLRLSIKYDVMAYPKKLFAYRLHNSNISKNLECILFYRLMISFELKKELIKYFRKPEHYYFYNLHCVYNLNCLKEFRKYYKIVNPLGKAPIEWKTKYILSYFPFITKLIVKYKLKENFIKLFKNYIH
jgi:glycosyltransferase involved in cell wall biosynthesis